MHFQRKEGNTCETRSCVSDYTVVVYSTTPLYFVRAGNPDNGRERDTEEDLGFYDLHVITRIYLCENLVPGRGTFNLSWNAPKGLFKVILCWRYYRYYRTA